MKLSLLKKIIKEEITKLQYKQPLNEDMGACAQMFDTGDMPGGYNPNAWRVGFAKTLGKIYFRGAANVPDALMQNPYTNFPSTAEIQQNPQGQTKACTFLQGRMNGWQSKLNNAGPKRKNMLNDRIGLANCMMMNAFYC